MLVLPSAQSSQVKKKNCEVLETWTWLQLLLRGLLTGKKSWLCLSLTKGGLLETWTCFDWTRVGCPGVMGSPKNSWFLILLLVNRISANWSCTAVLCGGWTWLGGFKDRLFSCEEV